MNKPDIQLRRANWEQDRSLLREVRERVFIVEQRVPVEEEWDDIDPICQHVIVLDSDGLPLATGRITPDGKLGRMAVLQAWRGRGIGAMVLQALLEWADEIGWQHLSLHAQTHAEGFYAAFGFAPQGEVFMEAGIEHRMMVRHSHAG